MRNLKSFGPKDYIELIECLIQFVFVDTIENPELDKPTKVKNKDPPKAFHQNKDVDVQYLKFYQI